MGPCLTDPYRHRPPASIPTDSTARSGRARSRSVGPRDGEDGPGQVAATDLLREHPERAIESVGIEAGGRWR